MALPTADVAEYSVYGRVNAVDQRHSLNDERIKIGDDVCTFGINLVRL